MQTQLRSQLHHHIMPKMGTMIGNDGLRDTKPRNDMIEYELCSCLTIGGKCRHCFGLVGEVVHGYNNISIPPAYHELGHIGGLGLLLQRSEGKSTGQNGL